MFLLSWDRSLGGAFNQQGNELTIDGDLEQVVYSGSKLFTHLVQVTGLPGPVTRFTSIIS